MAEYERRKELFEMGAVMNYAMSDPDKLKKIAPRGLPGQPRPEARGMLAIPKKNKRKRGDQHA